MTMSHFADLDGRWVAVEVAGHQRQPRGRATTASRWPSRSSTGSRSSASPVRAPGSRSRSRARAPASCPRTARTHSSSPSSGASQRSGVPGAESWAGASRCATESRSRVASGRRPRRRWAACSRAPRSPGGSLTTDRALSLATELEGHPDNAAAALLGGFTVAAHGEPPTAIRFDIPRDLRAILFIPDLRLATRDMRAALPDQVPLADAVANLQRVALGRRCRWRPEARRVSATSPSTGSTSHTGPPSTRSFRRSSARRATRARSERACQAPAARSSPSRTRCRCLLASRRPCARRLPTSTCRAASSSSRPATPVPAWSCRSGRSRRGSRPGARRTPARSDCRPAPTATRPPPPMPAACSPR